MRLLIDTHVLLWALAEPERLDAAFRKLVEDRDNTVMFSAASIREIAIKAQSRRIDFDVDPAGIARAVASGFAELPVTASAAARVAGLPLHHRDPFDRLLVAQAMDQAIPLYTVDRQLSAYSDLVVRL